MLALLIPGKKQVLHEFFEIWLHPLIDELNTLLNSILAYDVLEVEGNRISMYKQ